MAKIKEKLYEHRFGLFFFVFLLGYSLIISDRFRSLEYDGVGYSFYSVDFSVGFCTKLLPGAIYNLLIGKYTEQAISLYVKALILFVFVAIAILLEKLIKVTDKDKQKEVFFISVFASIVATYFFFYAGLVFLLDFHWIIATVIFFFCLSHKKLYVFIPIPIIYALMTHYVAMICYVPVCLLILLCKICYTQSKKERVLLRVVFSVTIFVAVGLTAYMALFELDNIKLSYPAFNSLLQSRGVEVTEYYNFAFFRENVEEVFEDYYSDETAGLITNIDPNQSTFNILFQTVLQQLKINLYLADHKEGIFKVTMFIPMIYFAFRGLIIKIKKRSSIFEKLVHSCAIILFVFICMFGLLFSTDTIRWLGNSVLSITIYYLYAIYSDKEDGKKMLDVISEIPDQLCYLFIMICLMFPFV